MNHNPPKNISTRLSILGLFLGAVGFLLAQEGHQPGHKYTPGRAQIRTYFFKEADKKMGYSIYVPSGYDKKKSYPLMVALHGLGGSDRGMIRSRGLTRLAQQHGYIVVAPMGYSERGWYGADNPFARLMTSRRDLEWSEKDVMNVLSITRKDLSVDAKRIYLMGHSMGGHGALTIGLKNPDMYRSISAFAPICSPINCPWGQKALPRYLGPEESAWQAYDATALVGSVDTLPRTKILIDQGMADQFLKKELHPHLFEAACEARGIDLELRCHDGYDHGYYFISTFMTEHLRWHAERLSRA